MVVTGSGSGSGSEWGEVVGNHCSASDLLCSAGNCSYDEYGIDTGIGIGIEMA